MPSCRSILRSAWGCALALALAGCAGPAVPPSASHAVAPIPTGPPAELPAEFLVEGFEQPNPRLTLLMPTESAATQQATRVSASHPGTASTSLPASTGASDVAHAAAPELLTRSSLTRSSLTPAQGLWSAESAVTTTSRLELALPAPADLSGYDLLQFKVRHMSGTQHSGEVVAAVYAEDDAGRRITGDSYPLTTRWQAVSLDLRQAGQRGLAVRHIRSVGIAYRVLHPAETQTLRVQTDDWRLIRNEHLYVGTPTAHGSFFVRRQGLQLEVGVSGGFELTFSQHAQTPGDPPPAWLALRQENKLVLGAPGTGLFVLDQDQFDPLRSVLRQQPFSEAATGAADDAATATAAAFDEPADPSHLLPHYSWPSDLATWQWRVVWTSDQAAVVEVQQVAGPFDRLGQPLLTVNWRLMIYRAGVVYGTIDPLWQDANADANEPVTVVLAQPAAGSSPELHAPNVLRALYPPRWQSRPLPHEYQAGAAAGLLVKTPASRENLFWRARIGNRRLFGVGLPELSRHRPIPIMLLAGPQTALNMAAAFSAYLAPPELTFALGRLDKTFPGDVDNDGFNDAYGFQTIRLENGRTRFTIDPGNRPLTSPAFLLTVPAEERAQFGSDHNTLLVSVDGQQILAPPIWPDGSWLVQLPWTISKPVALEAQTVAK